MTTNKLTDGLYRLTRNVEHPKSVEPKPDKRATTVWTAAATFNDNTCFIVRTSGDMRLLWTTYDRYTQISEHQPLFSFIEALLLDGSLVEQPVEDIYDLIAVKRIHANDIVAMVDILLKSGKIKMSDLEKALDHHQNDDDPDCYEAPPKDHGEE